jgi:LytS/YehU family sensor histidine kinase
VAALIGTEPPAARRMCFLMAGFFRKSLSLGRKESIPLSEEIYLTETFLAIEEVRFGERLRSSFEVDEDVLTFAVPPLVLQPLVENAVHHGIAHLVDGGVVRVAVRRSGERIEIEVENPCDPDRPASRGTGLGLANVKRRLETLYAHQAALVVDGGESSHRVQLLLPAQPATV